jgi:hypothetical protein
LPIIHAIKIIYPKENLGLNKENIQTNQANTFLGAYKISGCSSTQTPRWVPDSPGQALQTA